MPEQHGTRVLGLQRANEKLVPEVDCQRRSAAVVAGLMAEARSASRKTSRHGNER